ncbi:GntR family transcriptional regulator [Klebsiella oxytoca]|uniref:GntR family transcriptional regulator n=1 Tax=Klebsiella oxytoca TaxID=571 RepID=A0A318FDE0_KLEOX|nr:PLP-dependent aminotransferase family protein [Klebsiella oxytoca]PXW39012.1 GntR family transcriptional regulator [Klebsiella oxytoca]
MMAVKGNIDTVSIIKTFISNGSGVKYKLLAQGIEAAIRDGSIAHGTKLPPHRILADKIGVTAGTVSRAYGELERMGLVVARTGDGTFVRERNQRRPQDAGFRNFVDFTDIQNDMSRNMHISGGEAEILALSLRQLSDDYACLQELMCYTPEEGLLRHRQSGAKWLSYREFQVSSQQIICVNGSQHGLFVVLVALLRSGDTLVTEHLTYPGLISAARHLGIRVVGLDMDEEGLLPESLKEVCRKNRITALYCTPTLQNPTTAVMSKARRLNIARICRENNLIVIEDETHAVLLPLRPVPISHFVPERGVLIGGMSKSVAAGLRVGYISAPVTMISRISAAVRNSCWMATPLMLELASRWIENGTAQVMVMQQSEEISRRQSIVTGLLQSLHYRTHPCSPHFWIEIPAPWHADEIERRLREQGHLVSTAERFSVGRGTLTEYLRISVSNSPDSDQALHAGVIAVVEVLQTGSDSL